MQKENLPPEWTFLQQVNAPCHETEKVKNFFQKILGLWWIGQPSSNLNPLENLWGIKKLQIKKNKPKKLDHLRKKNWYLKQDSQRSLFETHSIYAKETWKSH